MDLNNTDDLPTVVDAPAPIVRHACEGGDPNDFTAHPAYQFLIDTVIALAASYEVHPDEVMRALDVSVEEDDRR